MTDRLPPTVRNTGKAFGFYRLKSQARHHAARRHAVRFPGHADQHLPARWSAPGRPASGPKDAAISRNFTRAANGDIVKGDVVNNARTDPFIQTDLSIHHEIPVHEGMRLEFEGNVINLFNQRSVLGVYENVIPTSLISPTRRSALRRRSAVRTGAR